MRRGSGGRGSTAFEDRLSDTFRAVGEQTQAESDEGFALIAHRLANAQHPQHEVLSQDSRLPWLSAAALILVLVGGGIFFTIGSDLTSTAPSPVGSLSVDDGPVYFLPPAGMDLSDGTTFYSSQPSSIEGSGIVVGRRVENGYDRISLIAHTPNGPEFIGQTINMTVAGRTLIRARFEQEDGTVAEELPDGSWIEYSVADDATLAVVVGATSYVGGVLRFDKAESDGLEVLSEVPDLTEATSSSLTHFRADLNETEPSNQPAGQEPVDGFGFNIVTMDAAQENALLWIGSLGGVVRETTVNDLPGYILAFPDQASTPDPPVSGLGWRLPSGQSVAIIANMDEAELRRFARELQPVDEETWADALEDAGASTFESLED